ncbi:MAG: hypothetical protein ABSF47_02405 [Minisyncoccia bacterium]|jgi:hypothetical protein
MTIETKNCTQCKKDFPIMEDDKIFYEKFKVPAPKMCPPCRAQRRLAFRNERVFYKRACDKCKKDVVSMYSPNKPYTVYCHDCWFSEDWSAEMFARPYDPRKSFLEQFGDLWKAVPKIALMYTRSVNSEYTNISADSKNCYMIVESSNNENCIHCYWIQQSKDLVDVSFTNKVELSYESDDSYDSYKIFYSKGCHDCRESYFLLDCRNCSDCFGCVNLRNKQYHVFNEPLGKDGYEKFLKEARLDTASGVEATRKKFAEFLKTQPRKYAEIVNAVNSSGNYIKDAKNCNSCFHCYDAEDSKYGVHVWRDAKDCLDVDTTGRGAQMMYNSMNAGMNVSNQICSRMCWSSTFMSYCYYSFDSNNCFGCVGLRNKNYCILNKQYEPEEYKELVSRIRAKMVQDGEYGEYLPYKMAPIGYNLSLLASTYFPQTRESVEKLGGTWDELESTGGNVALLEPADDIGDVDESIVKYGIKCLETGRPFNITKDELDFLKRHGIPVPRYYPDVRTSERYKKLADIRPREAKCFFCQKPIIHYYLPEWGYKKIACNDCYLKEVI